MSDEKDDTIKRLLEVLAPFAVIGEKLNRAGKTAWPDDTSARYLNLPALALMAALCYALADNAPGTPAVVEKKG